MFPIRLGLSGRFFFVSVSGRYNKSYPRKWILPGSGKVLIIQSLYPSRRVGNIQNKNRSRGFLSIDIRETSLAHTSDGPSSSPVISGIGPIRPLAPGRGRIASRDGSSLISRLADRYSRGSPAPTKRAEHTHHRGKANPLCRPYYETMWAGRAVAWEGGGLAYLRCSFR